MSQAEAVMDLIESRNELARKNSISQLKGGLSDKIKKIREEVLYQVAYIESALDDRSISVWTGMRRGCIPW